MEKIDILLWIVGAGFTLNFGLMLLMWQSIGKLDEKLTDVDRRLCRMEGAFSMKECCRISPDEAKKAA